MRSNYKPTSLTDSTLCVRHVNKMVAHPRTRDVTDARAHGAVNPLVAKLSTARRCIHISKGTRTCYARHAFQSYSHCKQRPKPATRKGASAGEEHHLRRVLCTEGRRASTLGATSCKQRSRCGCRNILRAKGARRRLKLRDEDGNRCGLISAPSRPRSVPPKKTIHAIYTSQLPVSCIPVYLYICVPYIPTLAKNEDRAVTIRIQRCTCALSAQLPPSTSNAAATAKARMRATAPQPLLYFYISTFLCSYASMFT